MSMTLAVSRGNAEVTSESRESILCAQDTIMWAVSVPHGNKNVLGLQTIMNDAAAMHVTDAGADVLRDDLERASARPPLANGNGNSMINSKASYVTPHATTVRGKIEPCQSPPAALRRPSPHRSEPGSCVRRRVHRIPCGRKCLPSSPR